MASVLRPRSLALLALLALTLAPNPAVAQNGRGGSGNARPLSLSAESVLLVEPGGRTLYAKNPEDDRAPASLVKLMTIYLAYEDLEAGRVELDEPVVISGNAAHTPRYRMGLRTGEQVTVRTLLEGVAIASANDAATALAERLSGDEAAFVARMNMKAHELGLGGTRFANAHGLPDPAQRSTARDLAQLTARLLHDHPASRTMLGSQTFIFNGRVHTRHIPLFEDPGGVQALKTGFTSEAGFNLAVSAWRNGQQFVMIVLGARTRAQSFLDAKKLLRYAFVEAAGEPASERTRPEPKKPPIRARRTSSH